MSDKVAIITAGGSGMGAAAARRLSDDGYRVAILSSSGKGEALATSSATMTPSWLALWASQGAPATSPMA